ncbi:hypothetical protein TNCV_2436091 [Trichonephila clavipes]|nr:hypothetical protein TNCV_2436091 [Trichonephila clavipes]
MYRPPPRSERYGRFGVGNSGSQKVGSGRPRNTNDREDRAIRRGATQRHLPPSRHPVPSRETIRRRLTEVGLTDVR